MFKLLRNKFYLKIVSVNFDTNSNLAIRFIKQLEQKVASQIFWSYQKVFDKSHILKFKLKTNGDLRVNLQANYKIMNQTNQFGQKTVFETVWRPSLENVVIAFKSSSINFNKVDLKVLKVLKELF